MLFLMTNQQCQSTVNYCNSINNNGRRMTLWTGLVPGSHGSNMLCTLFTAILLFIYFSAFLYPVHGDGMLDAIFFWVVHPSVRKTVRVCACVLGWRHSLTCWPSACSFWNYLLSLFYCSFVCSLYALCFPAYFLQNVSCCCLSNQVIETG